MDRKQVKKRLFFWYSFLWVFLIVALYQSYAVYFVDTTSTKSKWVGLFAGAIALLLASLKLLEVFFQGYKNAMLAKISKYFSTGASIYYKTENKILFAIAILICWILYKPLGLNFIICFLAGILCSTFLFSINSFVLTRTSVSVTKAIDESLNSSFKLALNSGVVIAMCAIGVLICAITILFHIFKDYQTINGFIFGSSVAVVLNCISNAISKRASKCSSDVVSSHVANLEKNDRRNPILLLKGICISVFDISSLGMDMYLSFASVIIASMTVGAEAYNLMGCFFPIIIAGCGIFASIIAILLIKINKINNPIKTLYFAEFLAVIILCGLSYYCTKTWFIDAFGIFKAITVGAFCGLICCFISANYIFQKYKPTRNLANASITGFDSTYMQAFREGFMSVFLPVTVGAVAIIASFLLSDGIKAPLLGIWGITLAILSMLSTLGVMASISTFALISSSADTVSNTYESDELSNKNSSSRFLTDAGFYTISLGRNFINLSSVLCALCVLISYTIIAIVEEIDILNPYVLSSLFIGAMIPYFYIACVLSGISKTTRRLIFEVKKQFRNFPQILRFEMRPDYEKCVQISARNSSIQAVFYTALVVLVSLLIAFFLKVEALAGLVFGVILSSCGLIFFSTNSSMVLKSAKKYLKNEYQNALNSDEYAALNLSSGLFEMKKDIITPCLNSLIKFLAIMILALAPLFM